MSFTGLANVGVPRGDRGPAGPNAFRLSIHVHGVGTQELSFFDAVGYPLAARAAIWARDAERARGALADLDRSARRGTAIDCHRIVIRAGIAALEGRSGDAIGLYRDAMRRWRAAGLIWDEALCAIDMATDLGPAEPEVGAVVDGAREILVRLGATPFVTRLDDLLAGGTDRPASASPRVPTATPR